ncbi:MAG: cytochrome c-type biogenesis CcmF C-terminal domain-containing protein, partial [Actinomycetota bacterium]
RSQSVRALVSVDGGRAYAPSITKFTRIGMNVGTPSVRTTLTHDIYLTLEPPVRQDSGQARIKVFIKPLILWLWIGTVFPLVVEAIQQRQIVVGEPFFDQLTAPIGLTMLFIMAVAPVLPWRRDGGETLSQRLLGPSVFGLACIAVSLVAGAAGLAPLLAFGLGGFAAGSALRHLGRAVRVQRLRGFVGRANGGMIVHLGVILICVALAAS